MMLRCKIVANVACSTLYTQKHQLTMSPTFNWPELPVQLSPYFPGFKPPLTRIVPRRHKPSLRGFQQSQTSLFSCRDKIEN